ncbi:MAG: argininosuccinate lyase [Actinomycetota bacterium]
MKLWGGRFDKEPAEIMEEFNASLPFDKRLYREDIEVNAAHAKMLGHTGIITEDEAGSIVVGLKEIKKEMDKGGFAYVASDEDIHTAIERALIEKIGPVGGKLRTGRSRNDVAVTDLRLYVKREADDIVALIKGLQKTLTDRAEADGNALMPGYTHLQKAQPILLGHHLMAYFFMLERDAARYVDCRGRADALALGSGALAGTVFPIDRDFVAKELGFSRVLQNSLDGVSDRDFALEFIAAGAVTMTHLSRLAEEMILWSTREFGFAELDESYSTGSSIMPQKKNPDAAELVRGKSGRVFGHLMGLLTVMKGLPLAYNKDLQEDKEGLFDTADTVKMSLKVMAGVLATVKFNPSRMAKAADDGFITATDLADYLAAKGVPFKEAHTIVGSIVKQCIRKHKQLIDLSLDEFKDFSTKFDRDVLDVIRVKRSVERRDSAGGTSPKQLAGQIDAARELIG